MTKVGSMKSLLLSFLFFGFTASAQDFSWCKSASFPSICVGEELSRQMRKLQRYDHFSTGVYQYSKGFNKVDEGTRKIIVGRDQGQRLIEYYGADGTLYTKFKCGWEDSVCYSNDRHILTILQNGKVFIDWEDDSHGLFTLLR